MDRRPQPAMPGAPREARPPLGDYGPGATRALRNGWAVTRWGGLVLACGVGAAAAIAVAFVVLQTLIDT